MKNFQNSEYAYNKFNDGIVYRFVDGTEKVITIADFLIENPDKTEEDFNVLKAFSDEFYRSQDRDTDKQTKRNVSIHTLPETKACSVESPEDCMVGFIEAKAEIEKKKQRLSAANYILDKLTETQRRRYLLYYVNGLTLRQIAKMEGVTHSKIQKSLEGVKKKINKFFNVSIKNGGTKRLKNSVI